MRHVGIWVARPGVLRQPSAGRGPLQTVRGGNAQVGPAILGRAETTSPRSTQVPGTWGVTSTPRSTAWRKPRHLSVCVASAQKDRFMAYHGCDRLLGRSGDRSLPHADHPGGCSVHAHGRCVRRGGRPVNRCSVSQSLPARGDAPMGDAWDLWNKSLPAHRDAPRSGPARSVAPTFFSLARG